jgi:hypothetical protein
VQHLAKLSQKVKMGRGTKKNTRCAVLYEKCKLHLVVTGQATSIDDNQTLRALAYAQKLRATMVTFGLSDFEGNVSQAMIKVQNAVRCILHLHKRIIEKIMSLVYEFVSMNTRKTANSSVWNMQKTCLNF